MGAQIDVETKGPAAHTATLRPRYGPLHGTRDRRIGDPRLIDEIPVLAVAAAARKQTVFATPPNSGSKRATG